jgi:hypothetical protein
MGNFAHERRRFVVVKIGAATMLEINPPDRSGVLRDTYRGRKGKTRLRTLAKLDQRTVAARRARELIALWTKALGGAPTPVEQMAISHAAACKVLCEDFQARRLAGDASVTAEQLVKLSNIMTRAVNALNLPNGHERERDHGHNALDRWKLK